MASRNIAALRRTIWSSPSLTPALSQRRNFWQADHKDGYNTNVKVPVTQMVKEGAKMLKGEVKMLKEEWKTKLRCDSIIPVGPGDYEYLWKFDEPSVVDQWVVTADRDHLEGHSAAQFTFTRNKTALFSGNLRTDLPKDGHNVRAGYCNITSPRGMKSFKRAIPYDWSDYTHLIIRVRGDGRIYQINILMDMYFDTTWDDIYHFNLYSRGGPYWQTAKIPLSKFYRGSKGRFQNRQEPVMLDQIKALGLTCADDNQGPFQLEIDYVGLLFDANHTEQFAYEMYRINPEHLY